MREKQMKDSRWLKNHGYPMGPIKCPIFLPGLVNIQKSNWKMAIEIVDLP